VSSELLSVGAVADLLRLHPKTVLRFIREGRLRAHKVGKQYRVLRSELNVFAGASENPGVVRTRATSIVEIDDVDVVLLQRLSAVLIGASKGNEPGGTPISLDIAHDPIRRSAKVIVIASPADAAALLKLVDVCLESRP
jgi:excisionase family DNA binding protein